MSRAYTWSVWAAGREVRVGRRATRRERAAVELAEERRAELVRVERERRGLLVREGVGFFSIDVFGAVESGAPGSTNVCDTPQTSAATPVGS